MPFSDEKLVEFDEKTTVETWTKHVLAVFENNTTCCSRKIIK